MVDKIPNLYETDGVPFEKKTIHQAWYLERVGFYWLVAELDRKENLAFGYANLNDDTFAEWGYISLDELHENGAVKDPYWKPCLFGDAQKKVQEYRRRLYGR